MEGCPVIAGYMFLFFCCLLIRKSEDWGEHPSVSMESTVINLSNTANPSCILYMDVFLEMHGRSKINPCIKSPFFGTCTKRCRWSLNHSTIPIGWLVGSTGGTQWWLDSMDSLCANLWPSIKAWRGAPREMTVGPSSRENERNGMLTLKRDPSLKGNESSSKHPFSGDIR